MQKGPAEGVRTDLIRWITIRWLRTKGYADLILHVDSRSGGPGWMVRGTAAEHVGALCSAAARHKARRSWATLALRGSIQAAIWLRRFITPCVIHLRQQLGTGRLGAGCLATMASLGGESRRGARVRATPGSVLGRRRVREFVRCKRKPR